MLRGVKTLALATVVAGEVFFKETFDETWEDRWVSAGDGKVVLSAGEFYGDAEKSKGMQTSQDARFYQVSALHKEFSNKDKTLVLSFSVKHGQKIDCGGGYLKFAPTLKQSEFNGDSEYNIMFGPDICGSSTKKVHVILSYKGKNVLINKNIPAETDQLTHTYTLILNPDQTYEVQIDGKKKESGSLETDFDFLAPKEIKDPMQSKPEDWVDTAMIDDPTEVKPAGHDDITEQIVDPEAEKPDDWDVEDDGEWEAPMISNPEYKGPWSPTRIENPEYKGPWEHPMVPNPEFAEDKELYAFDSFGTVGFDVWQVKSGTIIDNIIIADDLAEVEAFIKENDIKDAEKAAFDKLTEDKKTKADAERKAAEQAAEAEEEDDEEDDEEDASKDKEEL